MLGSSPAKSEGTGTLLPNFDMVDACRRKVKQLRKELKHMEHHGKIFLYDENSNLMYLMDAKDFEGDEIKVEDVESMEVEAIIWKDKKHHK